MTAGTGLDRRQVLGGFIGLSFAGAAPALAQQGGPFNVFAHRVMQTVATGAQGGDITKDWAQKNGATIQWTTFDTGPLQERLFREASLSESTVDVGFVLNTQVIPRAANLFEPLDGYLSRDPLEDPADIFPGLMEGMKVGGKQLAVPFRHASSGLHYNEELLAEKGFSKPPASIEELVEIAKACTYRRSDGTAVVGLCMPGVTYPNVIDIARAWDGDFITQDFKCVADQPPMLNAIKLLRALFETGAFPRNFATLSPEDVNVWMQTGRAAMSLQSMGRNRIYNDPQKSKFPGKIRTVAVPASKTLAGKYEAAPAKVEFWGMVIPRNAKRKDLTWSFIKAMTAKDATLKAALNGNGPVRASTYADAGFANTVPYAAEELKVLKVARVPLPAFDEAARAGDLFKEEAEAAVLGMKTPEEAMTSLVKRVQPLLPA
ncbi:ABC transporter substrate-binding protein [Bosea sp. 2KB_26]|uniref:ABC transporter substrate-binding protein n=1 Tax=Bosea sp. 2KB_26 TaxID=3237475 RepID=UPI003F91B400